MDPKHSHGPDRIDYQENPEDLTEVHAAILRENPEPSASSTPIPLWLILICGVAVTWAGAYLGMFHGGFRGDVFNERQSSPDLLFPQETEGNAAAAPVAEPSLAEQGKTIYANCVPCHNPAGTGTPGAFPPLAKSPFVLGGEKRMIAILLKGFSGPITVEGNQYNSTMPSWEPTLNDKKMAAVATFVRASFGNAAPEISAAKVAAARKEFADRKTPWTEAEIMKIPEDATLPDAAGAAPSGGTAPAAPAATAPAAGTSAPAGMAALAPAGTSSPVAVGTAPAPAASAGAASADQLAAGKFVYSTICFVCHQPTGLGLPGVFPPLTKSEYAGGDPERFAAMILKGNAPPMTVAGLVYAASPMPGQETMLTDDKIAAVMTYVRSSFGNNAPPVSADVVAAARKKYASRTTPWTEAELKAFPPASAH